MPLVPAVCTQCGSKLNVDTSKEAAICPYCKTPFITEDAINYYNTTNVTNIENLHADVVNVNDDSSRDSQVKSADTFIKLGNYNAARKIFDKLTEEHPYDYRGWWGLIRIKAKTTDFADLEISANALQYIEGLYQNASRVASPDEMKLIEPEYKKYHSSAKAELDAALKNAKMKRDAALAEAKNRKASLETKKTSLETERKNLAAQQEHLEAEFNQRKEEIGNRIADAEQGKKKVFKPSNLLEALAGIITLVVTIYVGISEGLLLAIVGGLFIFGAISCGAAWFIGIILDIPANKKERKINIQVGELGKELLDYTNEYETEKKRLETAIAQADREIAEIGQKIGQIEIQ